MRIACTNCTKWSDALDIAEAERDIYLKEAKRLWRLLDDISTAGDVFKPGQTEYVKAVDKRCDKREGLLVSDGYEILLKEGR